MGGPEPPEGVGAAFRRAPTVDCMNTTTAATTLGLPLWPVRESELVTAWRSYARQHHPDRCPDDPTAAMRFHDGRRAYDRLRSELAAGGGPSPTPRVWRAPRTRYVRREDAVSVTVHDFGAVGGREWRA